MYLFLWRHFEINSLFCFFGYSLKNIPITSKSKYLKYMTEKIESFVRRLRWKAYHLCKKNRENDSEQCKNFRFKTIIIPPQNEDLNAFENDMHGIINHLNRDIESIRSSKNVLVFAE